MLSLLRSSFGLWLLWFALLVAFLLLRPRPFSPTFWAFATSVIVVGLLQMARVRSEATAQRKAFAEWSNRLSTLGATVDVEDDGHLFEWLDPPHWQHVFAALEAMPQGSRSLRQAMLATHPEVLQ